MRKFLIALLAVSTLGAGSAFAQSGSWVGASLGYPFGATIHYGMEDLFVPDLDLRVAGAIHFIGAFGVTFVADALYNLDLGGDPNLGAYAGGGIGLGFATAGGVSALVGDLHGLFGIEYRFSQQWGVYGEASLGYGTALAANTAGAYASVWGLVPGIRLGVNYHF